MVIVVKILKLRTWLKMNEKLLFSECSIFETYF